MAGSAGSDALPRIAPLEQRIQRPLNLPTEDELRRLIEAEQARLAP